MKANFALILDQDGIVLLSRAKAGWRVVGQAHPASETLADDMAYLRRTAMELSGGRFATKLIIPNGQILYRILDVPVADRAVPGAIREALDGLTPYGVDELNFDWADMGNGVIAVAAVVDLTLSEAEAFAEEHKFNPLCFAAIPESADFRGEPYFGETAKARHLLNPGGKVERDDAPIDIVAVLAALEREAALGTASDVAASLAADAPVPLVARADQDEVLAAQEPAATPDESHGAAEVPSEPEPELETALAGREDDFATPEPEISSGAPESDAETGADAGPPEEDMTGSGPESYPAPEMIEASDNGMAEDSPEPAYAFSSRRTSGEPSHLPALAGMSARFSPRPEPAAPGGDQLDPEDAVYAAAIEPAPSAPETVTATDDTRGRTMATTMAALKANTPVPPERTAFLVAPPKPVLTGGGRIGRLGLLIGLGAAAAIALAVAGTYVMMGGKSNPLDGAGLAEAVPSGLPSSAAVVEPTAIAAPPPTATDLSPAEAPASGAREQIAAIDPALDTDLSPDLQALYGIDAPEITLSGIRQLAPDEPVAPLSERIDDLYLPSIDRAIASHDAVALPAVTRLAADDGVSPQAPPPAFGRDFALDAAGLVTPTPEGTLSPDGILIYAGAPAVRPRARPFAEVTPPVDGLTDDRRAVLAAIMPTPRPGSLVEDTERAQLGGLSRGELGGIRPVARPATLEALAEALQTPLADLTPTGRAIASSRLPVARPSGLAERAREVAVESVRPPAPPAGATVTQAATIQNGIRLNQVNLIGVYGSSSSRRALVRLSGGRFVMVTTGDRLDGGVVQAISSDQLIYRKGGRNITLEVPSG